MEPSIILGGKKIQSLGDPYIIAEIGVNHGGDIDQAKRLIDLAKTGGASAAKFQSYKADTLASKNSPAYWDQTMEHTSSQHQLFSKYDQLNEDDYASLERYCREVGIDFMSTPFDDHSVEFLEPLVSCYKVASADISNLPFLTRIGGKGKPVLLSTGAATMNEIETALNTLTRSGAEQVAILHCILNYPTDYVNANLRMIKGIQRSYPNLVVGYSDHTLPDNEMTPMISAYLMGAAIIEKHFTHDKSIPGNDHYHAMDMEDLLRFNQNLEKVRRMLGESDFKKPLDTEQISRRYARRSLVAKRAIPAGVEISAGDLTYKRPGTGISPVHWEEIIGRKTRVNISQDTLISWDQLDSRDG